MLNKRVGRHIQLHLLVAARRDRGRLYSSGTKRKGEKEKRKDKLVRINWL